MPTCKPTASLHSRAATLVAACLAVALIGSDWSKADDLAMRESSRRSAELEEGRMLLEKGDQAYQAGRFDEAVTAYAGARQMIPNVPLSAELHRATTDRFAQASIEHAKRLSRLGDVATAKEVMDKVLAEGVAPDHPAARACRAQLDDPIRTNPALTAEHASNVDEVRRLLYTAQGAYALGKFDEASRHYQSILRIDPVNSAARRGMESVAVAKSDYSKSAYDQTRGEMMTQVEAGWELQVPPPDDFTVPVIPISSDNPLGGVTLSTKLKRIIIPKLSLDQSSLDDAVDLIRQLAAENDTTELDPTRRGINLTVNLGPEDSATTQRIRSQRFDLQLTQVPVVSALKYLTDITQTSYYVDDFSVIIKPLGSASDDMIARSFRVPPDFLTTLSSGASKKEGEVDPFASAPAGGGLLTTRLSAKEAMERQGVSFPEGASVAYNAATNTLRVVNTANNLDFIAQIVDALSQTEPVMISVKVTMIRTQRTNLEELGFDWLVNPIALNSKGTVVGSGGTVGGSSGRTVSDFNSAVTDSTDPSTVVSSGVVTNGLRSGNQAITPNSIDDLVNNPDRAQQSESVAPGILSLTGLFTDGEVSMIMRGLDQKKSVDVMSQPSTVTRSGQSSSISIVREFIYPAAYEPPEIPTSTSSTGSSAVTPAMPTDFTKRDVGVTMEVLPVADANKRFVDVTLAPVITDFDGFINYGSSINSYVDGATIEVSKNEILMPIFSTQRATTQLTVHDGATIAIGGLVSDVIQSTEDKVPLLGDLPWVGRLFTSKSSKSISTAIIFLVRVELMDPTGRPYRDR